MNTQHARQFNRREFLGGVTLTGAAGLLGLHPRPSAAEPPPETPSLRLVQRIDALCLSPQYVAEEFLRDEGFTDVQYTKMAGGSGLERALASGEAHLSMHFAAALILRVEAGDPVVMLAGGHVGCYELFATDRVRAIRDLRGKAVAVPARASLPGMLLAIILAHVGLDPRKDVDWVESPAAEQVRLLAEGKIDAFLAFPPTSQELRAKRIGHVLLNTMMDRPWSQYFCCVVAGNREFVRTHPVATKRALRAILKSADLCALEPERAAQALVDKGYAKAYALQTLTDIPYGKWREYEPEDTIRFYALRLHEIGMIKSTPQKIIGQGTDWRFLNELKKELKR
jgi:NitT/TauT family transport system substrate-binding protein